MTIPWKGIPVPYVTAWSSETRSVQEQWEDTGADKLTLGKMVPDDGDPYLVLTYANGEKPQDRDDRGVLWLREGNSPGKGYPLLKSVHTRRQRRCMLRPACQVCGFAFKKGELVTWLLTEYEKSAMTEASGHSILMTATAPCCTRCMPIAAAACPHLRQEQLFVMTSGIAMPCGVVGDYVNPETMTLEKMGSWYYGQPQINTVYAKQQLLAVVAKEVVPYAREV